MFILYTVFLNFQSRNPGIAPCQSQDFRIGKWAGILGFQDPGVESLVCFSLIGLVLVYIGRLVTAVADVPSRSALGNASKGNFVMPGTHLELGERPSVFCCCPASLELASHGTKNVTFNSNIQMLLENFFVSGCLLSILNLLYSCSVRWLYP